MSIFLYLSTSIFSIALESTDGVHVVTVNQICNQTIFRTSFIYLFFIFLSFLGPHPQHMEIPRLGVKSEL